MNVYRAIECFFEGCVSFFWKLFILIHEYKNIWSKRHIYRQFYPTDEQAADARDYWKRLTGKQWPLWWHRLYASYTGKWDPKYIPEVIFSTRLEPHSSRRCDRISLGDKNNLALFTQGGGLRLPEEYLHCSAGVIFGGGVLMAASEAADLLSGIGPCVIKRTRDTSSGRDVAVLDLRRGVDAKTGKNVSDIMAAMGVDWVCQERVRQHASFAALYPSSVNTMRIVTYMTSDGVDACPVVLRLGRGGSLVDNAHAGGMFVSVNRDGQLGSEAYTEYQERFRKHPDTQVVFGDARIVGVADAVDACKRCHLAIGEFGFVSWDVAIDEAGVPVLIEVNLNSQEVWMSQIAGGQSMFGDDTEKVVRAYYNRRKAS